MNTPRQKRHGLTQIGNAHNDIVFYRRDAHCPVMVYVRCARDEDYTPVPSWLVNISEDACLVTSESFPAKAHEAHIHFPGFPTKVSGQVRKQGDYTLHIQFNNELPTRVVSKITSITQKPAN